MMMKALFLEKPMSGTMPVLTQLEVPTPGRGEVLIKVHAAALNYRELNAMVDTPDQYRKPPFVMGGDAAGTVVEVGEGVKGWQPGDKVVINAGLYCGECRHCLAGEQHLCKSFTAPGYFGDSTPGTFGEYYKLPARNLSRMPAHLSFVEAAALPIALGTAWNLVVTKGQVKPGDTVLIHGIGGGVALMAMQMAVARGARVIVTSGSDEKLARAREMGAAETIHYKRENVEQRVMELTGGEGVDVAIDGVGAATLLTSLAVTRAPEGKMIRFGSVTGATQVPSRYLTKTIMWGRMANQPEWDAALDYVKATRFRPVIDEVYPLEQFATAFERMKSHEQFGKILFTLEEE